MIKSLIILFLILICFINLKAGWFTQSSPVTNNLYSVNFNHGNENIAWACGESGTILYTSNGGINWIQQNSGTTNDLFAIVFMEISGGPVFACGENGLILRTSNNGPVWEVIPTTLSNTLRDISDFNFVAVGDSGVILKSSNNGLNWFSVLSPTTKNLYAVAVAFSNYAVGQDGTILNGTVQGTNWSVGVSGVSNDLYGVPLFGSRDITVGAGGLILRSTNSGANWYSQNSRTQKNIRSVEYSVNNTSRIYCVGDSGLILKTTNEGINWGFQNSGTNANLNSVFFYLNDNTGYVVGNNGTILKTTDGGGVITSVEEYSEADVFPAGYILEQNYPNPFNPKKDIHYSIKSNVKGQTSNVKLIVYNYLGKEISKLINENKPAGSYEIEFDGTNFSSGIYFYKLEVDGIFSEAKRMMLLK